MTTIYVKEQGARVHRQGERLVVSKGETILNEYPLANVEQLTLFGNVQLTTQAMATLLEREIDVVLLSSYGKFRGRLTGAGSPQVQLRQQQLRLLSNEETRLALATAIVVGKINNQRVILQRQTRRSSSLPERMAGKADQPADPALFSRALQGMQTMQQAATRARTLDALRGYEGQASVNYFAAIRSLLAREWGFEKRAYYPPPDPFNALLSFMYSLLLKDVHAAVNQVGLDPYLGSFHEVTYGRPSLGLDLMEEWRPLLADALVLELVNRAQLTPQSFRRTGNPRRPVELREESMGLVLKAYGLRLEERLFHPAAGAEGGQTTLRQAILLQARQFAQVVAGKQQAYTPVMAK